MSNFRPAQRLLHFFTKLQSTPQWLLLLAMCLLTQQSMAKVWYIAAGAVGTGDSWNSPNGNLLDVMNNRAVSGDEIWIEGGTYRVNSINGANQTLNSFILKSGVKVYGGFNGQETSVVGRSADVTQNTVTLTINGSYNYGYPIVYCTNANTATVLDRVTISGGNAASPNNTNTVAGSGMVLNAASPGIKDVSFTNNTITVAGIGYGSALFMINSSPTIQGGGFYSNKCFSTASAEGGAVNINGGSPSFSDVAFSSNVFSSNSTSTKGAAVYITNGAAVSFTNSGFTGSNYATSGGAVYITNSNASFTGGRFGSNNTKGDGGAVVIDNCSSSITFTNVLFTLNTAGTDGTGNGGAIYSLNSNYTVNNCVFNSNSSANGGAIYNKDGASAGRSPGIYSSLFYNNGSTGDNAQAGAIGNDVNSATITNCTFFRNSCRATPGAGGVFTKGTSAGTPTATITNCLFLANTRTISSTTITTDVERDGANVTITYSSFKETSSFSGTGNVGTVSAPFINPSSPVGDDGVWMTADDGLQLNFCNTGVNTLIDKGNNNYMGLTADLSGRPRKVDVGTIPDGGVGTAPIVDMGAYENQNGASLAAITGSIGNAHTVPNPQELFTDAITSTAAPLAGASIQWQKSENGGVTWTAAPALSPTDSIGYRLPGLTTTTRYRRVITSADYCYTPYYSNEVQIKVIDPTSDKLGVITGKVTSNGGAGVENIIVKAIRQTALPGSPANYTYTDTTDNEGNYRIARVFYGDVDDASATSSFTVRPERTNHAFDPASAIRTIRQSDRNITANFKDTTVISISGRTYQQCSDCIPANQQCPIDSILIYKSNNTYLTRSGNINGTYGLYNITVVDPTPLTIEPRFTGHTFSPAYKTVTPTDNVPNVDFLDVTTHTITGRLTDGCQNIIGTATLEFADVIGNDANGNPRTSCFRKKADVDANGNYRITLPARKYSVSIISFTSNVAQSNPGYIFSTDLADFFNNKISKDSLTRNITTADTVLNLRFIRQPVLSVVSGLDTICSGTSRGYAIFQQGIVDSFKIRAYQGPASLGCIVKDTTNKIRVYTSIAANDNANQQINYNPADVVTVRLRGGSPNIIAPYYKTLNIQYTDVYNRSTASLNKNVVVTGVKSDVATFLTVSPQIPLLVLHDPPGDNSYSYWQTNNTTQSAFRMYSSLGGGANIWGEVKIGADVETGVGVSTENKQWGLINGSLSVSSANTTSNETILTTTTTQAFSTSNSPTVVGGDGDLFIGAALNLIYAGATEIKTNGCQIMSKRNIIMADSGFATQYVYTEGHIRDQIIPTLTATAQNTSLPQRRRDSLMNQIRVWQQVLDNNAANKARAPFDNTNTTNNISFDGSAGPINNQTTTSVSETSSTEFALTIDATLAAELGFEIAGSGASGGVSVNFRAETGKSNSNTTIRETTTGYVLDDDDNGDYFSVNIKKDPVYGTPLFELAAGTASCPPEENAQPRDENQLRVPVPAISNIPANTSAQFVLYLGNTSQSQEARTYLLSFDQSSNPNGANVTIGGSQVLTPISYNIGYGGEVQVTVTVSKPASSTVFSFEGLKFILTDACTGEVSSSALISAYFVSPCSSVTLDQPENGWTLTSAANNLLPVLMKDYTVSGLSNIALEYSPAGTSNWVTGFTRAVADLNTDGASGTPVNWNVAALKDTAYNLRLKLTCQQGVTYSQRATGLIDRKPPTLFGRPTPTNDVYENGDVISFAYNEKLNTNAGNLVVTMRRLSNKALLPATASVYENKIVIVPNNNIASLTGDSVMVIISGVKDVYGNTQTKADTTGFVIGTSTAATGAKALTVSVVNPSVYKNDTATIRVYFTLPVAAANDTRVNYTIGGSAVYNAQYTASYTDPTAPYTSFNGATGSILIPRGAKQAVLTLRPVAATFDTSYSPDKTIIISATEGGDYGLSAATSVTGYLTSNDGITEYVFTGNGNWNVASNWKDGKVPLTTLVSGKKITISPSNGGTCILNIRQAISSGATLVVSPNSRFVIQNNLNVKKN